MPVNPAVFRCEADVDFHLALARIADIGENVRE
jgi:hypothetical protein